MLSLSSVFRHFVGYDDYWMLPFVNFRKMIELKVKNHCSWSDSVVEFLIYSNFYPRRSLQTFVKPSA